MQSGGGVDENLFKNSFSKFFALFLDLWDILNQKGEIGVSV